MTNLSTTKVAAAAGDAARRALRAVASGVTVLTVNHNGIRHGVTVSAVVAVSRDPLVLGACLRLGSMFSAAVRREGRFSVNILADDQTAVAHRFAVPGRQAGDAQFAGLQWATDGATGAPLIHGCVAHVACEAVGWHRVGDHDLLLAEVVGGAPLGGTPLVSYAGRLQPAVIAL